MASTASALQPISTTGKIADPHWNPVRPQLVEIHEKIGRDMIEKFGKLGFTLPGLNQRMAVAVECCPRLGY